MVAKLYDLLRRDTDRTRFLGSLVLTGGSATRSMISSSSCVLVSTLTS